MIEENVQEQEEFPESRPAEKGRFTDRVGHPEGDHLSDGRYSFYSLPFYIGISDQMEVNAD